MNSICSQTFLGRTLLDAGEEIDEEKLSVKIQRCLIDHKMVSKKGAKEFCAEQSVPFLQESFLRRGEHYNPAELATRFIDKLAAKKRIKGAPNKKEPAAKNKKEPPAGDK